MAIGNRIEDRSEIRAKKFTSRPVGVSISIKVVKEKILYTMEHTNIRKIDRTRRITPNIFGLVRAGLKRLWLMKGMPGFTSLTTSGATFILTHVMDSQATDTTTNVIPQSSTSISLQLCNQS